MSHDIHIVDSAGETVQLKNPHHFSGGTYAMGGTTEAWLNVTYNYSTHLWAALGEGGVRTLDGKSITVTLHDLVKGICLLGTQTDPDYWKPTEGNARIALIHLLDLAILALAEGHNDATWSVR